LATSALALSTLNWLHRAKTYPRSDLSMVKLIFDVRSCPGVSMRASALVSSSSTKTVKKAAQQAVEEDGRASWLAPTSYLSPVVMYHGLARRFLTPLLFLDAAAA